jgi:ribosomal protein S18 acetylase RimI-like enzyme
VKTTASERFESRDKMGADIEIRPATADDVPALVETQIRAFHDDSRRFGLAVDGSEPGGPPGYDSPEWQTQMMRRGRYFTIRNSGTVAGGMIVFRLSTGFYNLGRIWIDPAFQDLGIGRVAIEYLHETIGPGCTWTLDTPSWAVRNHHFYESLGYRRVGEEAMPDGWVSWLYRRDPAATA